MTRFFSLAASRRPVLFGLTKFSAAKRESRIKVDNERSHAKVVSLVRPFATRRAKHPEQDEAAGMGDAAVDGDGAATLEEAHLENR